MSSYDDAYMDDYDYYQNTGEPSEYFEEDLEEKYEEIVEYEPQIPTTMSNIKLKYLNDLTEIHDAEATKFGVELKSVVFRTIDDCVTLFLEFVAIPNRRCRGDLFIKAVLYDKEGDIFNTEDECIEAPYFKGFGVIKLTFDDIAPSDIGRVVINLQKM